MSVQLQASFLSEVAAFLASQPSLEALRDYRAPDIFDQRLHELLEKNSSDGLNTEELEEIHTLLSISSLMNLTKAKARLKLAGLE